MTKGRGHSITRSIIENISKRIEDETNEGEITYNLSVGGKLIPFVKDKGVLSDSGISEILFEGLGHKAFLNMIE